MGKAMGSRFTMTDSFYSVAVAACHFKAAWPRPAPPGPARLLSILARRRAFHYT